MVTGVLVIVLSVIASVNVILRKRDTRAAVSWIGLIWLAPLIGPTLYLMFGINRIRRRVAQRRAFRGPLLASGELPILPRGSPDLPVDLGRLSQLAQLVGRLTARPLTTGNAVTPLENGDEAFPAMIAAIDAATVSVAFSTYIFDNDTAGNAFFDAFERATKRGIEVRVLVDAVGARYSWPRPRSTTELQRRGVPCAVFGPTLMPWRWGYFNLRNHRKLLVVDAKVGFTGGINIREGCLVRRKPKYPVRDVHFRLEGPVVAHLSEAFIEDWGFTTGEMLSSPQWIAPNPPGAGRVVARGIPDGPDEDFEKGEDTLLGAVACAQKSITVVTPYFLPDLALTSAMGTAALRGVQVDIVLPAVNNLLLVHWASRAQLWQVLQRGCRVFETRGVFDHSKMLLVDGTWARFGSSNWDPRSLRLNWEFDVECYDRDLVQSLEKITAAKLEGARVLTLKDLEGRSILEKLRDGVARFATPYL
ncbi:MAG: cardiolipin synthase [Gemmatimonadetes bacterium]|nr:cardiolipin synthase [Gemmatimonadota bacterium]